MRKKGSGRDKAGGGMGLATQGVRKRTLSLSSASSKSSEGGSER